MILKMKTLFLNPFFYVRKSRKASQKSKSNWKCWPDLHYLSDVGPVGPRYPWISTLRREEREREAKNPARKPRKIPIPSYPAIIAIVSLSPPLCHGANFWIFVLFCGCCANVFLVKLEKIILVFIDLFIFNL